MEIIKDLGTNGGGFFNVNASHPFENPNAFTAILPGLLAGTDCRTFANADGGDLLR